MDRADRLQQFLAEHTLQLVSECARLQRTHGLHIPSVGCQDDNAGLWKRLADGFNGVDSSIVGQLEVHERNVGKVSLKALDSFARSARLSDNLHVGLVGDHGGYTFPYGGMIVNDENTDTLSHGHRCE